MTSNPQLESERSTRIGFTTLVAIVVANMIGIGLFTSSGWSLGLLHHPGRVMLAWWICGVWAVCGAVAYGGLVSRLPQSGGEYLFLSRFVHPAIGFLAGWISVVAGFTAPIAASALGAATYALGQQDDELIWSTRAVAASLIAVATVCHLAGLAFGARVQNAIVGAKLSLLFIGVAYAYLFMPSTSWQGMPTNNVAGSWWPEDLSAWTVLAGSMSWIALSYTGFNAAIYVAGESQNARKNVPAAMVLATLLVTSLYLLVNYVFVYAPKPETIENQGRIATIVAEALGGPGLEMATRITIVLSMTSSVFAMLLAGPRVYYRMAEDRVLPSLFLAGGKYPAAAILVQATLSLVVVLNADLLSLLKYLGLTLSACGALAVSSLWWVRSKLPDEAGLKWWESASLVVYLGITACILWASRQTHAGEFNAMVLTFALGLIVYMIGLGWQRRKSSPYIS